jgi:hypothetical protein
MKILAFIITVLANFAVGAVLFFFLLMALNGFSERDANPAIVFYVVWAFVAAIGLGIGSFFLTKFLIAKSFNAILALVISVIAAVGLGAVADFGGIIAGAMIASEVRESYMKK